ncbi:MFS transporter [Bacillus carboniphilus]|uniref:MFS transporter n=1 Tax=Bacillus carboniphilus TaxID=86663 RepID=A0ABY9JWL3_9BACI|nr:MFS transporter [Bacillus carboniphilus]WLR42810.1 MFS transporter [Bacillus carboniphilus]
MLRNKNILILLSGELIAGLGLWLGIIGNLEFLQAHVPSDFLKSVILAVGLLAGIAVGPLAGRLTDQINKKSIMLVSGFIRTISVTFMFVALYTESIWWMIIFLILIQISAAFYFPALQSAIPLVVEEKDLLKINGIYMNVSTLSRIVGTALAGVLLVILSLYQIYFLSLIAYLILFTLTFFLNIEENKEEQKEDEREKKEKKGFTEVLTVIKDMPVIAVIFILSMVPFLFIGGI